MAAPIRTSLDAPDDRIELAGITADVVEMGDTTISRSVFQPGVHCSQISHEGSSRAAGSNP